jgi:hypothetical protein
LLPFPRALAEDSGLSDKKNKKKSISLFWMSGREREWVAVNVADMDGVRRRLEKKEFFD